MVPACPTAKSRTPHPARVVQVTTGLGMVGDRGGSSPAIRGQRMDKLDLARWQFAATSINHFFFVPVTIGLAFLTALLQTAWFRNGKDEYLRLTRFFGTLLVINVAIGVV